MITKDILNILACPICKGYPLELRVLKSTGEVVIKGVISCSFCGRKYPINEGISCMLPDQLRKDDILEKKKQKIELESINTWSKKQKIFLNWLNKWDATDSSNKIRMESEKRLQKFFDSYELKDSILDIGCGRGEIRPYLKNNEYIGIDPANFIMEGLTKEIDFPFIQSTGEYLPFRDESFDNILILAVLDHVIDPNIVLKESFRVLRSEGCIHILSSLEAENLGKKVIRKIKKGDFLDLIKGSFSYMFSEDTHLHHFTANYLIKLVSCYFEKIEIQENPDGILFIRGQK